MNCHLSYLKKVFLAIISTILIYSYNPHYTNALKGGSTQAYSQVTSPSIDTILRISDSKRLYILNHVIADKDSVLIFTTISDSTITLIINKSFIVKNFSINAHNWRRGFIITYNWGGGNYAYCNTLYFKGKQNHFYLKKVHFIEYGPNKKIRNSYKRVDIPLKEVVFSNFLFP